MTAAGDRHLAFLRTTECCICGDNASLEACHVRYSDHAFGKYNHMGKKPRGPNGEEWFCVPMCKRHHDEQHRGNERAFYYAHRTGNPLELGRKLWDNTGNAEACEGYIRDFRERSRN